MTEREIADKLGVDRSTISRDIQFLKEMSNSFTYYMAESNLSGYYRQQFIDGIEEVKGKVLNIDKEVKNLSKKTDRMINTNSGIKKMLLKMKRIKHRLKTRIIL
jgi:hypothetical protein